MIHLNFNLDSVTGLQLVSALIYLINIILWGYVVKLNKIAKPIMYMLLSYLIHVLVFYLTLITIDILDLNSKIIGFSDLINSWSTGIRIHLSLIVLISFITVLFWKRVEKWIQERL